MTPCVRGRWTPPDRSGAARLRPLVERTARARARSGRGPGSGAGVRRVPHRPAPGRGRPAAAAPAARCPATRSSAWSTRSARVPTRFAPGDRIGVAWLRAHLRALPVLPLAAAENLCPDARVHRLGRRRRLRRAGRRSPRRSPTGCPRRSTTSTPRRCCAPGIIGYRALRRAELPPGGRLGIYGFGGVRPPRRPGGARPGGAGARADPLGAAARELALELGAALGRRRGRRRRRSRWTRAILFAPVGRAGAGRRCGRWTAAARWPSPASTSATSRRSTTRPSCSRSEQLRSVTANTRADGEEFLRLAAALRVRPTVRRARWTRPTGRWPTSPRDRVTGAAVLTV